MKNIKHSILLTICFGVAGCDNPQFDPTMSPATSEVSKHSGTIIYTGNSFQVARVNINGINYLCNSAGGIVKE